MLDPLDWKYEHRLRLLIAAAFGALLGFTTGSGDLWFNLLCALIDFSARLGALWLSFANLQCHQDYPVKS